MEKESRLLNVKCAPPRASKARDPQVEMFSWPDGTHVALDANSLCAVQVDHAAAKRIAPHAVSIQSAIRNPESAISFTGLLFSRIAPEFSKPELPRGGVRKLVLNLTHACNLRCKYCFAAEYEKLPVMSLEIAQQALGLFDEKTPISVSFFGGEPMLGWPTLILAAERVYQLAYERKVPYSLHVTTNGTLIDPMKAAALKRFNFSVLLSCDGPKEIHNASRPTAANVQKSSSVKLDSIDSVDSPDPVDLRPTSFDQVMSGLDALNDAGIVPMARATFSELPANLIERLEFFDALYRQGKISGASIEPAILAEGCSSVPGQPLDLAKLESEWHAAAEWFVARVKAGRPFPFFYFRKLLARLLNCEFHGTECGAGRGYLTVGPDGAIYACHRESGTKVGRLSIDSIDSKKLDSIAVFDSAARSAWITNCVDVHPECHCCWARYLCGGGCAQNRVEVGGAVSAPVPQICAARKAMMKQVLWIAAQLTRDEAMQAAGLSPARAAK